MKINITPPKYYLNFCLRSKTKKYFKGKYNKLKAWSVFEGKRKNYYLYITKGNIQIELIENCEETINDIEKYLEFMFYNSYIGISFEGIDKIQLKLKNVNYFYL